MSEGHWRRRVPLGADLAPGCDVTAASSSCTGDTEARSTASASAAGLPLPPPAAAADTPSGARATPASPAWVSTGSHLVPLVENSGNEKVVAVPVKGTGMMAN